MDLTRDAVLALQRHFFGALSAPSRTWIEPLPATRLLFAGSAIGRDGVLDLGLVESPGEERRLVRVSNAGPERVEVRLGERPPWLRARWAGPAGETVSLDAGGAGTALEVTVTHEDEQEFRGWLPFEVIGGPAPSRVGLTVRMTARRSHPLALFDFNGSPSPRGFDFSAGGAVYELSVGNRASVPLVVSFAELPAWLRFEVDGYARSGPAEGRFFERTAPFTVKIRPVAAGEVSGRQRCALRLESNDPRPELRSIELPFAAAFKRRKSSALPRPRRGPIRMPVQLLMIVALFAFVLLSVLVLAMRGLS